MRALNRPRPCVFSQPVVLLHLPRAARVDLPGPRTTRLGVGFGRRPFLFLTTAKVDPAALAHGGDWYAGTYYAVLAASP
jgi:hypothetical protein